MLGYLNEHRKIFVVKERAALAGYVYVDVDPQGPEGVLEFLGTEEAHRGKGIGKRLMTAGVHFMFSHPNIEESWLYVDLANTAARRLYEGAGWTRVYSTRASRRPRHLSGH